jgi:ABC-2 type transport system ATP-binding protein
MTYQVHEGEVFGLLGPNGAGKTTTVRLLNGVLTPTGGHVRVLGLDPTSQSSALRRRTGVLTENPSFYERLTVRENLTTHGRLYGVPETQLRQRVDELLETFGLWDRASDKIDGFSKGMKQRLALARAVLHDPELLFLDEPTSGLDPEAARQMTQLIAQLSHREGRTVFLCTHNLDEAQRLCDRVAVMNQGRLLAVGSPAEVSRTLWQNLWVDVTFLIPPTPDQVNSLRALGGVRHVQVEGVGLAAN